ncbi:MAG: hypothetical protein J6D28_01000 [Bacilli bacterium]|nr:hypothetical protein [Bacilli bacterium]MBP3920124.1 hypothetical protein [Bacilli bacterium]
MSKFYDVHWTLPHQKRAFGSTTIATDNLIVALSEEDKSVLDVYNSINYDEDAKAILKHFIDAGYGNFIMKDFVTQNPQRIYRKFDNGKIVEVPAYDLKRVITKELKQMQKEENDLEIEI